MTLLKKIPFFLFLLAVFFCLHGAVDNFGFISVKEVLGIGFSILAGMTACFVILLIFYRKYIAVALIVFFISLWYLFFGALHDTIKSISWLRFIQSYTVLLPLLIAVTIAWIILIARKKDWWPKLTLYLNILLLIYCTIDAIRLISRVVSTPVKQQFAPVLINTAAVKVKPNVYFLLLDEYAGYASLKDSFGFRNDSFYHFLQQKGFEQLPVVANYDFTTFCMSAVFNMRYVSNVKNRKAITQYDYLERLDEIDHAEVFSIFKKMGYRIYNHSLFDVNGIPAVNADYDNELIPRHRMLLTDKILHSRLDKDIGWAIPQRIKKWLPFLQNRSEGSDTINISRSLQLTRELATSKKQAPVFCYTHVLMPHWYYYYDSAGRPNPKELIRPQSGIKNKKLYLGYLHYCNRLISRLVSDIIAADPDGIIVLMSDHGFRSYEDNRDYQPFRFDNICAVRVPGTAPVAFNHSIVNFFPYLLNRSFGQRLPYLKDSSIALMEK